MFKFILKLIFILIVLGLLAFVIYTVGVAAIAHAKEGASEMGVAFGPTMAAAILFIAVILLAIGGDGNGK